MTTDSACHHCKSIGLSKCATAQPKAPQGVDEERLQQKAFEAWRNTYESDHDRKPSAFETWQAAIAWHKQHMQSPEMVEKVARKIYTDRNGKWDYARFRQQSEPYTKDAKAAIAALME